MYSPCPYTSLVRIMGHITSSKCVYNSNTDKAALEPLPLTTCCIYRLLSLNSNVYIAFDYTMKLATTYQRKNNNIHNDNLFYFYCLRCAASNLPQTEMKTKREHYEWSYFNKVYLCCGPSCFHISYNFGSEYTHCECRGPRLLSINTSRSFGSSAIIAYNIYYITDWKQKEWKNK